MRDIPWRKPLIAALLIVTALAAAGPASALKVATYNILNFQEDSSRIPYLRTVMDTLDVDVVVVQEMIGQFGVNDFQNEVLNYNYPGKYNQAPFVQGPNTGNALFYKASVIDYIAFQIIYTDVRYTSEWTLRPDGYASSDAEFRFLSTHLKAGSSSSDINDREDMCNDIRDHMNGYASGTHFILGGDFNMYTSSEAGYQRLIGSEADNDGRCKDPANLPGYWHDSYTFRHIHSQSPREDAFGGGASGGMDDRYDIILVSYSMDDGDGLSYVDGSYDSWGNDGYRLNGDINDPTNQEVSATVADALYYASDHIPVVIEVQLPAKVGAPSTLDFGDVIVGTSAVEETLAVENAASAPADELSYDLSAPGGFGAPGGSFQLDAGQSNDHTITMDASAVGVKSGDLTISSNDLDDPSYDVALSGTVVDHASPSLSDMGVVLTGSVDFGSYEEGNFPNQTLSVYNDGYGSLQALLEIYDAEITGGDGRFSFVGGFTVKEAGSSPAEYELTFDDAAASSDSVYTAVLTLSTRDAADTKGGTSLDDLVVDLEAYVIPATGVPGGSVAALALSRGMPNPFTERTSLVLSLPESREVTVEIYDVAGRLVRTLAAGRMPSGANQIVWTGRDGAGRPVASGIYFCRASVGDWRGVTKLALFR